MKRTARREFLKHSLAGAAAMGLPSLARAASANEEIRLAVIGLGGIEVPGGVGGRGRQLIERFREVPGVRIAALCDVDQEILDHSVQQFKARGESVASCRDLRKVFDDKSIDAVIIATPNHWHALATIWACQAGKDVYVEKPFSHNIWEGRQMIAAARKYGRIVQNGTQSRSSEALRQAFEYLRGGQLGAIQCAHAIVYRARVGIGRVETPTPVPAAVDYDLWCGPASKGPVMRKQFHYEWHWFWETGNGEIGNNGAHAIDVARWGLGQDGPPARALSVGGRFGFDDGAETPNTQIALFDYRPAPLVCEIRNLRVAKGANSIGKFRGRDRGVVILCEGGYFAGESLGGAIFDRQDKKSKEIPNDVKDPQLQVSHAANFIAAVRSRKAEQLKAEARVGYVSAICSHLANVSQRLGKTAAPEAILEANRASREFCDAFDRCREYLKANGVDLGVTPATLGAWVQFDAPREEFVGEHAEAANRLSRSAGRGEFVVPESV